MYVSFLDLVCVAYMYLLYVVTIAQKGMVAASFLALPRPFLIFRPNHLIDNLAHCKVGHSSKAWKRGSQRLLFLLAICLNGKPRIPDLEESIISPFISF